MDNKSETDKKSKLTNPKIMNRTRNKNDKREKTETENENEEQNED